MTSPSDKGNIQKKANLTSTSFNILKDECVCLNGKKFFKSFEDKSTQHLTKSPKSKNDTINSLRKKFPNDLSLETTNIRKDRYGNTIEKGGKHKVSFRDDIKGQLLVEMTLVDINQKSIRSKNYKDYTIYREARDKEGIICSGLCNIF